MFLMSVQILHVPLQHDCRGMCKICSDPFTSVWTTAKLNPSRFGMKMGKVINESHDFGEFFFKLEGSQS